MKTFKIVLAAITLVVLFPSPSQTQTLTKGLEYQPQVANPCHPNTTCGWVAPSGQFQFFDGVTATAKTVPTIVTSAKGDLAIWNGTAWQKLASSNNNGEVLTVDTSTATGWKVAPAAGGGGTLAQTYADGTVPADSVMTLDSTRGPVVIRDNATPLTGSLFKVETSDEAYQYIDVNPTENATQFGVVGPGQYGVSLSVAGAMFGALASGIFFSDDNAVAIGSSSKQASNIFTRILSAATNTLAIIGGNTQINLSSTGFDPNTDVGPTLGTVIKRFLSIAAKTGTIFYDLMGSSSAQGRGLLLRGTALSASYPGAGQVEYSPMIEFQEAFGATIDPESGFATARMALQGQMPQTSVSSTAGNQIAVLSDSGTGTYTKVLSIMNNGSLLPATDTGPVCGDATHRFLSIAEGNNAVGTGQVVGISLSNKTAATVNNQKYSPMLEFEGQGWKTNATAGSQSAKVAMQLRPVQDGPATRPEFVDFYTSINNGAYTRMGTIAMDPGLNGQGIALTSENYNGSSNGMALTVGNSQISLYNPGGGQALYFNGGTLFPTDLNIDFGSAAGRFLSFWSRAYYGVQQNTNATGAVNVLPYLGETIKLTATGNVASITIAIGATGAYPNQTLKLILIQDAAGAFTWPSTMTNVTFAGGTFTKTTTANAVDVYTITYDASNPSKWREVSRSLNQAL